MLPKNWILLKGQEVFCFRRERVVFGNDAEDPGSRRKQSSGHRQPALFPDPDLAARDGGVRCRSHLAGMLNYYDRAA